MLKTSSPQPLGPDEPESEAPAARPAGLSRRGLLSGGTVAGLIASGLTAGSSRPASAEVLDPQDPLARVDEAIRRRRAATSYEFRQPPCPHPDNGDDERYPNRIGSYSKGLPHNDRGEVDPAAYEALLHALETGAFADFAAIPLGGVRKLVHPQGSRTFEVFGPDSHHLAIPPAPELASAEAAAELVELYWMALLRDVPFAQWSTSPLVAAAAAELSGLEDYRGPVGDGAVTPELLFRMDLPGALVGPYLSQFLLRDVPVGAFTLTQTLKPPVAGRDYLTTFPDWLNAQRGGPIPAQVLDTSVDVWTRNGRDLGQVVHIDVTFQTYWHALLILLRLGAALDPANPYVTSANQTGNAVFGPPHVSSLLGAVAQRATKAVWFQKWGVHRRLRPEAMGGRAHVRQTQGADYPLHPQLFESEALARTYATTGTYLLPQAYAEGSPVHPSYSGGHAVVAGACITVLKAHFDESWVLPAPLTPTADGSRPVSYTGGPLTLGGELNKLAANVALGRDFAGIHYRSDSLESLRLGEQVAIRLMREDKLTVTEPFSGFSLTKFDGSTITI